MRQFWVSDSRPASAGINQLGSLSSERIYIGAAMTWWQCSVRNCWPHRNFYSLRRNFEPHFYLYRACSNIGYFTYFLQAVTVIMPFMDSPTYIAEHLIVKYTTSDCMGHPIYSVAQISFLHVAASESKYDTSLSVLNRSTSKSFCSSG